MTKAIVVTSGGMDSTTAVYWAKYGFDDIICMSFNYGQRHVKELQSAEKIAKDILGVPFRIVELPLRNILHGSALTDNIDVPEGHYTEESMKATVVPNRNSIMLNIAIGAAVAEKADAVVTGVHAGDHAVYPDCRPLFIDTLNQLAKVANEGFILPSFEIVAPYISFTKADIVADGMIMEVPFAETWTCYQGGRIHCGRCATCVERLEAFALAGFEDPVEYEDRNYWQTVT